MTDPSNLVERLRIASQAGPPIIGSGRCLYDEAAAEIERLTALTTPSTPESADGLTDHERELGQAWKRGYMDGLANAPLAHASQPAGGGLVEVVQADREAARPFAPKADDASDLVQAFARHRLQALAPATVEAREDAAAYVDAQDCNIQNREGDFDGYSGQKMVEAWLAGHARALQSPSSVGVREARSQALEEAARVAFDWRSMPDSVTPPLTLRELAMLGERSKIATAIRALADLPPTQADRLDQGEEG